MRRALLALGLIAATIVPALVATVWLFGCCVLPFHRVLHHLMPLCRIAIAHGSQSDEQTSTLPQPDKRTSPQRVNLELTSPFLLSFVVRPQQLVTSSPAAYRSFITLGAVRCDRDVGLHTLFVTFLI